MLTIVGAALLLAINAFFVAAEFSAVSARRSLLETAAPSNLLARLALEIKRKLNLYLSSCQVGVTVASLGLGAADRPDHGGDFPQAAAGGWRAGRGRAARGIHHRAGDHHGAAHHRRGAGAQELGHSLQRPAAAAPGGTAHRFHVRVLSGHLGGRRRQRRIAALSWASRRTCAATSGCRIRKRSCAGCWPRRWRAGPSAKSSSRFSHPLSTFRN